MKLEYVDSLTLAHPFIKGFEQVSYCLSEEEVRAVAQGEISDAIIKRKKEDIEGKEGASPVYSTTFYIGLAIEPKPRELLPGILDFLISAYWLDCFKAGVVGPRKLDISYPTTEFIKLVKVWEHFNETTMGIVVRHIRRFAILGSTYWLADTPPFYKAPDCRITSSTLVKDLQNLLRNESRYALLFL